jgi:hypothetical protein
LKPRLAQEHVGLVRLADVYVLADLLRADLLTDDEGSDDEGQPTENRRLPMARASATHPGCDVVRSLEG